MQGAENAGVGEPRLALGRPRLAFPHASENVRRREGRQRVERELSDAIGRADQRGAVICRIRREELLEPFPGDELDERRSDGGTEPRELLNQILLAAAVELVAAQKTGVRPRSPPFPSEAEPRPAPRRARVSVRGLGSRIRDPAPGGQRVATAVARRSSLGRPGMSRSPTEMRSSKLTVSLECC